MDDPDDVVAPIAALFDEHCGFVWRSLRHLGVDEPALDDAVQDVFITAHRRWSTFERRSSARTWLFGIARRVAYRYRRSARTRSRRFVGFDVVRDPAEHPVDRFHAAHALASLIARLDGDKRAVFVLSEIEGMTAPEVSEALGIPLGTAYSRLRAAWQTLGRAAGKEQLRELGRMRSEPDEAARRRMWGAIAIGTASGRALALGGLASQLKWIVAGAALGAGLLGVGAVVLPPPSTPHADVVATRSTVDPPEAIAAPQAAPRANDRTVAAAAPVVATPSPAEPAIAARPSTPPRRREASTQPSHDASLAEELQLVRDAQQAVRDRRADDALALLAEHARRFPDGQLAAERSSTRITALCVAGRTAEATTQARALGRTRAPCDDAR